jgi:hypothetical protein
MDALATDHDAAVQMIDTSIVRVQSAHQLHDMIAPSLKRLALLGGIRMSLIKPDDATAASAGMSETCRLTPSF